MSYVWRLLIWLAASALIVVGTQLKGWAEPLVSLCGIVLMFWPVWLALTGRHSPLDKPMVGWARWLAGGLALILFLGSMLIFLQPAESKRAHDFASLLLISGFGFMSWAGLWKRQER